jgi:hypothetical protein
MKACTYKSRERQISGTLRKEIDGIIVTLKVGEFELKAKRKMCSFSLGKQSSVEIMVCGSVHLQILK